MNDHSAAYRRFVRELQHTPTDSVDHRVGVILAVSDTEASLQLLYAMYDADRPQWSRAFHIAADGLHLLNAEVLGATELVVQR